MRYHNGRHIRYLSVLTLKRSRLAWNTSSTSANSIIVFDTGRTRCTLTPQKAQKTDESDGEDGSKADNADEEDLNEVATAATDTPEKPSTKRQKRTTAVVCTAQIAERLKEASLEDLCVDDECEEPPEHDQPDTSDGYVSEDLSLSPIGKKLLRRRQRPRLPRSQLRQRARSLFSNHLLSQVMRSLLLIMSSLLLQSRLRSKAGAPLPVIHRCGFLCYMFTVSSWLLYMVCWF